MTVEPKQYEPEGGQNVPRFCKKDLLAVMGTADPSRSMAPFDDDNFEIWGCSVCTVYPDVKRIDVLFEMHGENYWKHPDILPRLQKETVPIYMQEEHKEIPGAIKYPVDLVSQYKAYSTSTISYMLALAYHSFIMTEMPKHVALFGIQMYSDVEYSEQRPCVEYWLGRMEGAGMDVMIAPGSAILGSPGMYGYENINPLAYDMKQRLIELEQGLEESRAELEKCKLRVANREGGIYENEKWMRKIQKGEIK